MITVFHKGDAAEILATLKQLGIVAAQYDLRTLAPEAAWVAGQFLRSIDRVRDLGDGSYQLLTPTTTVDNHLGRHVIAGDYPDTLLAALPAIERQPAGAVLGVHERQPDGRCSCKTSHTAQVLAEVNVTEPQPIGGTGGIGPDEYEPVLAPVCPECRSGKHRNCDGLALDEATDEIVPCTCPPAFGHRPRDGNVDPGGTPTNARRGR